MQKEGLDLKAQGSAGSEVVGGKPRGRCDVRALSEPSGHRGQGRRLPTDGHEEECNTRIQAGAGQIVDVDEDVLAPLLEFPEGKGSLQAEPRQPGHVFHCRQRP